MIVLAVAAGLVVAVGADVCEPYEQLEKKLNCGPDGYLLHYGLRNCRNFNSEETRKAFSTAGKTFLKCTTSCLTRHLNQFGKDPSCTCSSVATDAFNSHTDCYIECAFCKICKTDKTALLRAYDFKDFFSFKAMRQIVQVTSSCSWFGLGCLFK